MNKELTEKLWNEFPLLYQDKHKSIKISLIPFGFECENGWFDLLYEASAKIEPIIRKIKEKNAQSMCYKCLCKYSDHRSTFLSKGACERIHKFPYSIGGYKFGCTIPQWRRDMMQAWEGKYWWAKYSRPARIAKMFWKCLKIDWEYTRFRWLNHGLYKYINISLNFLYKAGLHYKKACHCDGYEPFYPRASQVKEKFGTLRFYMSHSKDEINKIIRIAEDKSEITCEICGNTGETHSDHGWIRTMCKQCEETK